jgi:hypothetical protein
VLKRGEGYGEEAINGRGCWFKPGKGYVKFKAFIRFSITYAGFHKIKENCVS